MSKVGEISKFLEGSSFLPMNGLGVYHGARAARDAKRVKELHRLEAVKRALKQFRVNVEVGEFGVKLTRPDTNATMIF